MVNSRYQTLPTHPKKTDDSYESLDQGPLKCYDRMCSSFPLVTFFASLLMAVMVALTLSLSLSKSQGVFVENSIYSATCVENMCLFGFSEYPRDIPCIEDKHCSAHTDPCASNPCDGEGTDECMRGPKGDYVCLCKETYNGRNCEKKLNRCDYADPCFGQSTCVKHPTVKERFSCRCELGWMGTECEYRSQTGDTCASHRHCSDNGRCLKRDSLLTCHCSLGYHGLHCMETVDVEDCLTRPCASKGQCVERDEGYGCLCSFGRGGKQCQQLLEYDDCDQYCEHGGKCETDPTGLPVCKCEKGYGGDFCTVRDVSEYRRYKGAQTCHHHAKFKISFESLKGRWFLVALKDNPYNPPDACVQLSVVDDSRDLKSVIRRNDSLMVRYLAKRNDTSSHYKVEKVIVDETKTIMFVPGGGNTTSVFMIGRIARLYAFPLTDVETHDDHVVEFGVVYSNFNYLVLHSCIPDATHGYFDALLILSREKNDINGLKLVLDAVYRELPYVSGRTAMIERDKDCKD